MLLTLFFTISSLLFFSFFLAPWAIFLVLEIIKKQIRLNKEADKLKPYQMTLLKIENVLLEKGWQLSASALNDLEQGTLAITQNVAAIQQNIRKKGLNEYALAEQFEEISDLISNIHRMLDAHLGTPITIRSIQSRKKNTNEQ